MEPALCCGGMLVSAFASADSRRSGSDGDPEMSALGEV